MTTAQEGGKVSLTHRPHLPPGNSAMYVCNSEDYGDSDLGSVTVDGCVVPNVPKDWIAFFTNQNPPTEYLFFGNQSSSDTVSHPRSLES